MKCLFYCLLITLSSTAAIAHQASTPDGGDVKDGVYSNRFFGFAFTHPKNWVVHGEATQLRIKELGKERLKSSGILSENSTEVILKNTYQLLTVFQHPVGTPGITINPLVQVIAEDVRHAPGITTGQIYLKNAEPLFSKTMGKPVLEQPSELFFAGRQFFRQDFRWEVNGISLEQAYVITVEKGWALAFVFTAGDQATLDEMVKSMKTIRFKEPPPGGGSKS